MSQNKSFNDPNDVAVLSINSAKSVRDTIIDISPRENTLSPVESVLPPQKVCLQYIEPPSNNGMIDNDTTLAAPDESAAQEVSNSTHRSTNRKRPVRMPGQPGLFWIFRAFNRHYQNQDSRLQQVAKHLSLFFQSSGGLFLVMVLYTLLGATAFMIIEGPQEMQTFQRLEEKENQTIERLWSIQLSNASDKLDQAQHVIEDFKQNLEDAFKAGITRNTSNDNLKWDFLGSILFCITTYTTIGYGHVAPSSKSGRVTLVIYAMFGIPLCMMVLARVGAFLNRFLKTTMLYCQLRMEDTTMFVQYRLIQQRVHDNLHHMSSKIHENIVQVGNRTTTNVRSSFHITLTVEDDGSYVSNSRRGSTPAQQRNRKEMMKKQTFLELYRSTDETFDIPMQIAVLFVMLYILIGSVFYSLWEGWSYLDTIYFIFVSISTIGFGDMVPLQRAAFVCFSFYVIFGLALISMAINILMGSMSKKLEDAQARIAQKLSTLEFDHSFAWKLPKRRKLSF